MRLQLVCENDTIGTLPLRARPLRLGRHPENDVVLKDDLASRFHCVVEPNGEGSFVVKDLGSRNGTKLNNEQIEEAELNPGDVLRVGGHVFKVESFGQPAPGKGRGTIESGARWAVELIRLIEMLPPKQALESISLIDAGGKVSSALDGVGSGAIAIKLILLAASKARATDVHCEPKGDGMQIRVRVDGSMISIVNLPNDVGDLTTGLIKAACQMKTAARDSVLEGHFSTTIDGRRVDYRASFTPSVHGQKLVIRVLDLRNTPTDIHELGMTHFMLDRIRNVCHQDAGMLLVVGPTGSGKTTTLYNAMRQIDVERRNVITIEDPVEYHLEGITQIPAADHKGNSFNALLRSVLRQDPDVIFVGEIRDEETARTAMQAAMTGHVVFSTLHAKDTVGTVFRLLDLGVEPYLVANSLNLVLAQRLVRQLCDSCKRPAPLTPAQSSKLGRHAQGLREVNTPTGCGRCLRTGFRGRKAIFEMLHVNDEMRDLVLNNPSVAGIKRIIKQEHFTTLRESGWRMVADGLTSIDEIEHVVGTQ